MGRGCMFSEEVRNVRVLGLTISALILAYGAVGAIAEDRMTQQPDQQQMQSHPMGQEDAGTMEQGGMMGRGMMVGHMTGHDGATDYVPHDVRSDGPIAGHPKVVAHAEQYRVVHIVRVEARGGRADDRPGQVTLRHSAVEVVRIRL